MNKQLWNNNWKVWEEFNAFSLVFAVSKDAMEVNLPFDYGFYKGQKEDSINQGRTGSIDGGVYNYYKKLYVESGRYQLLFEGNGGITQVYVNGSLAGESRYPYNRFYVELTPYLNYGKDNDILVVVKSFDLSSRWYVGSGITRNVYLCQYNDIYMIPDHFRVTTLDVEGKNVSIKVEVDIQNDTSYKVEDEISFDSLITGKYPITILGHSTYHYEKTFYLEDVNLWDEDHPYLYNITCISKYDKDTITTGFRKLQYDAIHGLRVNGKEVKLLGGCIHHDQGILGGATYDDYELFRVKKLKEAGFNAVRSAHNPASVSLLKACDTLGMYIMDEGFDIWFKMKNNNDYSLFFESDYEEVIQLQTNTDYNHPSVVLYSTGNEISNINTVKGFETSKKLMDCYHRYDDTRPVTNGINGAFACGDDLIDVAVDLTNQDRQYFEDGDINKFMAIVATQMDRIVVHPAITKVLEKLEPTMDIMGYNYMTARYLQDHITYPQRIFVGTETYPKQIYQNYSCMKQCKAIIGDFTWTGFDYLGEVGNYPKLINEGGDISFLGERRPMSYYRELVFEKSTQPYIAVRKPDHPRMFGPWKMTDATPFFDYQEGELVSVEVYSSAKTVELFLNGESLGKKETVENTAFYDADYQAGKLEVKAYYDDKVTTATLYTSGTLQTIETKVHAGKEIDIIEILLLDEHHQPINTDTTLSVEGNILSLASYNQKHPFTLKEITVHQGRALLIVPAKQAVTIKVANQTVMINE